MAHDIEFDLCDRFDPASSLMMSLAHDWDFVDGILSCRINNGHGNRRRSIADSIQWTVGSHYAACRAALHDGITCSPTSGFHHAGYSHCHGFCTINGLMVSAAVLFDEGRVQRVGIVDYDYHFGDGTDDIICQKRWHDRVAHVNNQYGDTANSFLNRIWDDMGSMGNVDLVMYQAGADMHEDDPLGGILNTEEMRERDRIVFEWCKHHDVPCCFCFAGGYQRDENGGIPKVLELHRGTFLEAMSVFGIAS